MANLNPDKQNTYPKLSPSDLKDPSLFRLQTIIDFLYSRVEQLEKALAAVQSAPVASPSAASTPLTGSPGRPVIGTSGSPKFLAAFPSSDDTIDFTGSLITAPNGVGGLSGAVSVRNSAGTGVSTFTVAGGLITNFTP